MLNNLFKNNKNTANLNSNINEETREKFILKGWIESSRKATCTKNGTRGFLFGSQTPSKMDFSLGRSMVEMLGVLAIIGVLSIGGISGYTIAMRRYRANEIVSVMQKYATLIYSSCLSSKLNGVEGIRMNDVDPDSDLPDYEERTFHSWATHDFLVCPMPISFLSAGLGGLPSGARAIYSSEEFLHEYDGTYYHGSIVRSNSGDIVRLYVSVDSHELCQTIHDLVGSADAGGGEWGRCNVNYSDPDHSTLVSFIMN